jgi:DnaJ-domain-containing protein 1
MMARATAARLEAGGGGLVLHTRYDPSLVAALKTRIPATSRKWDNDRKAWVVDPRYGQLVGELVKTYLGETVSVPAAGVRPSVETRMLRIEYLGRCKPRGVGEPSAMGWADGGWSVVVPESVLRAWFEPTAPTARPGTFYGILLVAEDATDAEIRSAYRRLAKQWHPDVSKEPDAKERFQAIQRAYSVLSDPQLRRKYDAGLAFEASSPSTRAPLVTYDYRSPLRCGWVLAEGTTLVGRFVVKAIHQWTDIVDGAGRTMVTSWPVGAEHFVTEWV